MNNIEQMVESIGNLTLMQAVELRKNLEEKFDVKANSSSTIGVGANIPAVLVEEKSEFSVKMLSCDSTKRISVIKTLKDLLNIPLTDAKNLTDSLPKMLKEDLSKEESEKLAETLRALGAVIEII